MKHLHLLPNVFIFCLISMQLACAQKINALPIDKIYAFSEQRFLGNLPVDENGVPTRPGSYMVYTLYIETHSTQLPEWKAVRSSDRMYPVTASEAIAAVPLTVGKEKATGKTFTIIPAKGSHLWKLELGEGEATSTDNKQGDTLVLQGKYKGNPFVYTIKKMTELETFPQP